MCKTEVDDDKNASLPFDSVFCGEGNETRGRGRDCKTEVDDDKNVAAVRLFTSVYREGG